MGKEQQTKLLLNEEVQDHASDLVKLLVGATQLECMVAFAKTSGLGLILPALKKRLSAGMVARFAIGLDFCQTEPKVLRQLLKLNKTNLTLFLSDSAATFHPKIYALSRPGGDIVLIGSANMTGGGLRGNYEASARIDDPDGTMMRSVSKHIDDLVDNKELVLATPARIDNYERRFTIYQAHERLAKRRVDLANARTGVDMATLGEILDIMKGGTSDNGFESQKIIRSNSANAAVEKIMAISSAGTLNEAVFLQHYEQLIQAFHSGGLHRGKNIIAREFGRFQAALVAILQSKNLSAHDAYQLLQNHFRDIPRAGVNVLTEILLAIDSTRFAVMNQNSVSGLRLAKIYGFRSKPTKQSVDAEQYERFCHEADVVRIGLGLGNFTELDAVFNYAYWGHEQDEQDEHDEDDDESEKD